MNKYLVNAMMLGTGLVIGSLVTRVYDEKIVKDTLEEFQKEFKKELDTVTDNKIRSLRKKYVTYSSYPSNSRKDKIYEDIIFGTRKDAEEVLSKLADIIKDYGHASVANLCDLSGIISEFTDHRYIWTDTKQMRVEKCINGYTIKLPKPTRLKSDDVDK